MKKSCIQLRFKVKTIKSLSNALFNARETNLAKTLQGGGEEAQSLAPPQSDAKLGGEEIRKLEKIDKKIGRENQRKIIPELFQISTPSHNFF